MPGLLRELRSHRDTNSVPNPLTEPGSDHVRPYSDADPGPDPGPEPESDPGPEPVARIVRPNCGPIGVAYHLGADPRTEPDPDYLGSYSDPDPGSEPGPEPEPEPEPEPVARIVRPYCGPIGVAHHLGTNHLGANHLGANASTDTAADNHANPRSNSDVPRGPR